MLIKLLVSMFIILYLHPINAKLATPSMKKFENVRVNDKNFAKIRNMHINWYATSIKALMGQLGKELYTKLDQDEQRLLTRCLDKIDDRKDLVLSAQCLIVSRKRHKKGRKVENIKSTKNGEWQGGFRIKESNSSSENSEIPTKTDIIKNMAYLNFDNITTTIKERRYLPTFPYTHQWNTNRTNFKIPNSTSNIYSTQQISEIKPKKHLLANLLKIQPISIDQMERKTSTLLNFPLKIRKPMAQRLRFMKARSKRSLSWFRQGREEAGKFHDSDSDGRQSDVEPWKIKQADHTTLTTPDDRSPISRITNLISMFVKTPTQNNTDIRSARQRASRWSHTYGRLLKMKKTIDEKEKSPGAKAYSMRMYDLVLGNERPTVSAKQSRTPKGLVDMAMDLFSRVGGDQSKSERRRSNSKFLSPRFAPLMPDKVETDKSELSPTILAFYEEPNNTANIASIPQLLKSTGMEKKDSDAVMGMIMDVSGARDTVEDALGMLNDLNFFGIEGEVMGITEKLASVYDNLEKSMKPKQTNELDKRGFAFLDMDQINKVYKDPALNVPEEAMDFENYARLSAEQREESLWKTIEKIAINKPDEPITKNATKSGDHRRFKRTGSLTIPSVLAPTVLAPFMFSPVFGLIVLGPTVLSPNLFSPLILNPAVLSPYVLSPAVGIPFIISPYVLSPYVLSPLVFAPFILNPYVLSPNVLNPYLLSPLILSPLVLCPDVISPMALGGAILSPSVASPAVFTETYLMANVLSPSFLS